ncbi:MAG: hypothetical protein HY390_00330 [Deltaproteobacteria bacterium]|nr:hypothetical protein [Deltaproteobacteria bacterium]
MNEFLKPIIFSFIICIFSQSAILKAQDESEFLFWLNTPYLGAGYGHVEQMQLSQKGDVLLIKPTREAPVPFQLEYDLYSSDEYGLYSSDVREYFRSPYLYDGTGSEDRAQMVALSADGKSVAYVDAAFNCVCLDFFENRNSRTRYESLYCHSKEVKTLLFDPSGRYIVSGGLDQELLIWDRTLGDVVQEISHPASIYHAAFTSDGNYLISASSKVHILNMQTHESKSVDLNADVDTIALHPSQPYVVVATAKGIYVIDIANGSIERDIPLGDRFHNDVNVIQVSPDGAHVLILSKDDRLAYLFPFELDPRFEIQMRRVTTQKVTAAQFHPTEPWLLLGDEIGVTLYASKQEMNFAYLKIPFCLEDLKWSSDGSFAILSRFSPDAGDPKKLAKLDFNLWKRSLMTRYIDLFKTAGEGHEEQMDYFEKLLFLGPKDPAVIEFLFEMINGRGEGVGLIIEQATFDHLHQIGYYFLSDEHGIDLVADPARVRLQHGGDEWGDDPIYITVDGIKVNTIQVSDSLVDVFLEKYIRILDDFQRLNRMVNIWLHGGPVIHDVLDLEAVRYITMDSRPPFHSLEMAKRDAFQEWVLNELYPSSKIDQILQRVAFIPDYSNLRAASTQIEIEEALDLLKRVGELKLSSFESRCLAMMENQKYLNLPAQLLSQLMRTLAQIGGNQTAQFFSGLLQKKDGLDIRLWVAQALEEMGFQVKYLKEQDRYQLGCRGLDIMYHAAMTPQGKQVVMVQIAKKYFKEFEMDNLEPIEFRLKHLVDRHAAFIPIHLDAQKFDDLFEF